MARLRKFQKIQLKKRKLKNGSNYELRWWEAYGSGPSARLIRRSQALTGLNRDQAEQARQRKQAEIQGLVQEESDATGDLVTLGDLERQYLAVVANELRPTTLDLKRQVFGWMAKAWGRSCALRRIDPVTAAELVAGITNVSTGTRNKYVRDAKSVFNKAVQWCMLDKNPFAPVRLLKTAKAESVWLPTADDCRRMLFVCQHTRQRVFIGLAYEAGLRSGEVQHLTWEDFDLTPGRATVTVQGKKGDAADGVLPFEPKDHECRTVPIGEHLADLLRTFKDEQAKSKSPYLFLSVAKRDRLMARWKAGSWRPGDTMMNNVLRDLRIVCQRAELGEGSRTLTYHDLRRACLTNWAEAGLPIHVVKELAGHASVTTTEKFYVQVRRSMLDKARELSDKMMPPKAAKKV